MTYEKAVLLGLPLSFLIPMNSWQFPQLDSVNALNGFI